MIVSTSTDRAIHGCSGAPPVDAEPPIPLAVPRPCVPAVDAAAAAAAAAAWIQPLHLPQRYHCSLECLRLVSVRQNEPVEGLPEPDGVHRQASISAQVRNGMQ